MAEPAQEDILYQGRIPIYPRSVQGRYRRIKWGILILAYGVYFLLPWLRWSREVGPQQAVLFDIPNRQFHILGVTVLPQDFWMLSLTLLFFALLLAVVTALAGRIYCGFFCFQTVWTDVFTWIEDKLEGNPQKRRKLDKASLSFEKLRIKVTKHLLWLLIAVLTGISFVAWFYGATELWHDLFTLRATSVAYGCIALFTAGIGLRHPVIFRPGTSAC